MPTDPFPSASLVLAAAVLHPLARGALLGLGAAVPIGPVNVEIARRALRHGFRAGFALGLGAVTVDVTYAVLSTLSVVRLLDRPAVTLPLTAFGAALLAYLGVLSLRAAARHWRSDALAEAPRPDPPRRSLRSAYLTGLLMTLLNPMTLAFWFTVMPAQAVPTAVPAGHSAAAPSAKDYGTDLPMICAGVFLGTVCWVVAFAGLLGWAGRRRRNWWMALADGAGGLTLLAFAALAVARLLRLVRPVL